MIRVRLTTALLLVAVAGVGRGAEVPAVADVVVTGERAGPSMWHVHRGDADLWILGSLSPLPRDITWRSREVERVMQHAKDVLVQEPFDIGIPSVVWTFLTKRDLIFVRGGKRLRDVMQPDLYARFARQRAAVTDDAGKWERYRPIIAAAFVQREAFHRVNLSLRLDLGAAVRKLAKDRGVHVTEIKTARFGDMLEALKTLPASAEETCVNASLTTMESGLPRLIARARAWADGDIEQLAQLEEPAAVNACREALDDSAGAVRLVGRMRQMWLQALQERLQSGGTTLAVVNLDLVLQKQGGLLDALRERGYEVDAP